ncbi:MAG: hypothetical protein ACN4GW_06985 [Desulforhopalus sp.]
MTCRKENIGNKPHTTGAGGYCHRCETEHFLGVGNTVSLSQQLMQHFEDYGTIDLFSTPSTGDESLHLNYLFGPARGKMFGLLECRRDDGKTVILRAFSGQYNTRWLVQGWVPPLFSVDEFNSLTYFREKQIKELGSEINRWSRHSDSWLLLRKKRRHLSQELMRDIHDLYSVSNFRGETVSLDKAFTGSNGIPSGTGDCCAPKLLNFAARNKLHPLGISEFYWGRENRSGTQSHASFTSSCKEKCAPILGFMLCGLNQEDK